MTTVIEFDLYCVWDIIPPSYRIYADDELLTERSYIWDEEHCLREKIMLTKVPASILVIPIGIRSGKFTVENVKGPVSVMVTE